MRKKPRHPQNVFIFGYFITFLIISFHSIPLPYTIEENDWSMYSKAAKGAEIFNFLFWGGILKKFTFKVTSILEIAMFMFNFLNLPASWIVLIKSYKWSPVDTFQF